MDTTLLIGGTIDLAAIAFQSGATATLGKTDEPTISDGGRKVVLTLAGNYGGETTCCSCGRSAGRRNRGLEPMLPMVDAAPQTANEAAAEINPA